MRRLLPNLGDGALLTFARPKGAEARAVGHIALTGPFT